jgi:hypothetical protein
MHPLWNGFLNRTPHLIRPGFLPLALRRHSFRIVGSFLSAPRFPRVRLR